MNEAYDIFTEEDLKRHCSKTEELADEFRRACEDYADAKIELDKRVVKTIANGKCKESTAYEKILTIVASQDEESQEIYETYLRTEQLIKGLQVVINTREKTINLHQSLMKNRNSQKV